MAGSVNTILIHSPPFLPSPTDAWLCKRSLQKDSELGVQAFLEPSTVWRLAESGSHGTHGRFPES